MILLACFSRCRCGLAPQMLRSARAQQTLTRSTKFVAALSKIVEKETRRGTTTKKKSETQTQNRLTKQSKKKNCVKAKFTRWLNLALSVCYCCFSYVFLQTKRNNETFMVSLMWAWPSYTIFLPCTYNFQIIVHCCLGFCYFKNATFLMILMMMHTDLYIIHFLTLFFLIFWKRFYFFFFLFVLLLHSHNCPLLSFMWWWLTHPKNKHKYLSYKFGQERKKNTSHLT